jgi:thiamine kinase-like enzyme
MLLARQIGSALAELHKLMTSDQASALSGHSFTADPPWVLSVYQPNLALLGRISAANLKFVRTVQQYAGFAESLERLSLEWKKDRLIHFDIKSDNLITVRCPSGRWTRVTLVDWELVGLGDACWDIGSVFADYLVRWLISMPQTEGNGPERVLELSGRQLVKIQRALRAFWEEYLERMPSRCRSLAYTLRRISRCSIAPKML